MVENMPLHICEAIIEKPLGRAGLVRILHSIFHKAEVALTRSETHRIEDLNHKGNQQEAVVDAVLSFYDFELLLD
jgi:hypothetical protein